jgi:multicomponent Na+:H+ antiporter subunit C
MILLDSICAVALFSIGLYGVLVRRNLVKVVMSLSLMEASTYLLLVAFASRRDATAPIVATTAAGGIASARFADPFLQNICLTAIIIGVAITAVFLSIAVRAAQHLGTADTGALRQLHG